MTPKPSSRRSFHGYQSLEPRQMLASITALDTGEVRVLGDDTADVIRLIGSSDFQSFTVSINSDPSLTERFSYSDVTSVRVFANGGNDTVANTLLLDTFIFGGDGDDILQGGFLNDLLSGGDGDDILNARNGDDLLNGGAGNDRLAGFNGEDRLFGLDGEDRLFGGNGDDVIVGGTGNDFLRGDAGNDAINGNEGDDLINAGLGADTVNGGLGSDRILGVSGINTLNGNGGDDTIFGGTDADEINGGSGDDRLVGRDGEDFINGDAGADVIFGGAEGDNLTGGFGNDSIFGQEGDDTVAGNEGNDSLFGNDGDDLLGGGDGIDSLFGNDGDDQFFVGNGDDTINGGSGLDDVVYRANQFELQVDRVGASYRVTDIRLDPVGVASLTNVEGITPISTTLNFTDSIPIEEFVFREVDRRITVQPIVAADDDGSNAANGFGSAEQEAEIKRRVNLIYRQAGIDVEFLPTIQFNNTFVNGDGTGDRSFSDFSPIIARGDAAGVGSSDPTVIDLYFVSRTPGFGEPNPFSHGGGLAFVGRSGTAISVGDFATNRDSGRDDVAEVIAHEIGHNLGLGHTSVVTLLSSGVDSELLLPNQIDQARQSFLTRSISGGGSSDSPVGLSGAAGDSAAALVSGVGHVHFHGDGHDHTGDTGGCDCGVCGLCTGANPATASDSLSNILNVF